MLCLRPKRRPTRPNSDSIIIEILIGTPYPRTPQRSTSSIIIIIIFF